MPIEPSAAHRLIESHRSLARAIAAEILRTLPPHVEKDDIEAAAELGLTEAANAFDPSRGVQFQTFAYYRIRGAVYDAIRKATWFSREQYKEVAAEAKVNALLADESSAADPKVASAALLERHVGSVVACFMLSIDSAEIEAPQSRARSAEQRVIDREWRDRLHRALAKLPEKQRSLLRAYYFEEKSLEEIGAGMGLSKSWTCRLHAKAIDMLRRQLEVRTTLASAAR
jgi:RNA polymerase sigma factor for flagellar operon FliA